jgi:hypothetical protein
MLQVLLPSQALAININTIMHTGTHIHPLCTLPHTHSLHVPVLQPASPATLAATY